MFVGKTEEGPIRAQPIPPPEPRSSSNNFNSVSGVVQIYSKFIDSLKRRHECCPHKGNCVHYAVMGGLRPLVGGIGLQILLKLVLSIKKIVQLKLNVKKVFLNRSTIKLGVFLGGFSFLFKAVSCSLRHIVGQDHPLFALPAGFIASTAFFQYPDTTVALYVMWKMLQ
uniref:Transmembrane protein 135 N-terminal domain-containing protein n=1 Tax=Megaselia scalaris TaxID=36166 RepID=T1H4L0_MEGSC